MAMHGKFVAKRRAALLSYLLHNHHTHLHVGSNVCHALRCTT